MLFAASASGQSVYNCTPTSNQDPPPGVTTLAANAPGVDFKRLSFKSDGGEIVQCPGDNGNRHPSVNGAGTIVAWSTDAESVVGGEDNPTNIKHVYARLLPDGNTFLVTGTDPHPGGIGMTGVGDAPSDFPWVVGTVPEIVFQSRANIAGIEVPYNLIFVHSIDTQANTLLSANVETGECANDITVGASASSDGRFVVYSSQADNLVSSLQIPIPVTDCPGFSPADTRKSNIFLHDRGDPGVVPPPPGLPAVVWPSITWISVGRDPDTGECAEPDGPSRTASISANGCRVVFESDATNLVQGLTGYLPGNVNLTNVFLWDRSTGQVSLVSHSVAGPTQVGNGASLDPRISADGRFIVFRSLAGDLPGVPDPDSDEDVYVYDTSPGPGEPQVRRVSINAAGVPAQGALFKGPGISPNGRWALIASPSQTFNELNGSFSSNQVEMYLRDLDSNGDGTWNDPVTRFLCLDGTASPADFADGLTVPPAAFLADSSRIVLMTEASDLLLEPGDPDVDTNKIGGSCQGGPPASCRQCGLDIYVRKVY